MEELFENATLGRVISNLIGGISVVVAGYLLFIAYKKIVISWGLRKRVLTSKYVKIFDLNPPYAKGAVQFGLEIEEKTTLEFKILDKDNNLVQTLFKGEMDLGVYPFEFDTSLFEDGMYYYQVMTDLQKTSKKFYITNKQN